MREFEEGKPIFVLFVCVEVLSKILSGGEHSRWASVISAERHGVFVSWMIIWTVEAFHCLIKVLVTLKGLTLWGNGGDWNFYVHTINFLSTHNRPSNTTRSCPQSILIIPWESTSFLDENQVQRFRKCPSSSSTHEFTQQRTFTVNSLCFCILKAIDSQLFAYLLTSSIRLLTFPWIQYEEPRRPAR